MKKVYLVPHCHWDREWYFSNETANVLFHSNMKELVAKIKDEKQLLDGQWSLLDDYLKSASEDFGKIKNLLKSQQISSGAFYSQPDVLNSQAETIIRNLEIGKKEAERFGVKNTNTAYLPDTFGFGSNILNIFENQEISNFVFWRGLPREEVDKSVVFNWTNENYKVKAYCLKDGYYSIGMYYPYNGKGGQYPEKWDPKFFAEKIEKRMNEVKGFKDTYIFPLGGDQAPFIVGQNKFLNLVKKELLKKDIELEIVSNYDHFFESFKFEHKYSGDLIEPFTAKIHRTIGSSRYDIKKLFRSAEDKLYGLLEPLEIYYKSIDKNYDFENYKIDKIIKPLLIAQTHDSLGACNTDTTNQFQVNRLNLIHENIDSMVDLLMKRINQHKQLFGEEIIIFNPSTTENYVFEKKVIFSNNPSIDIDGLNIKVRTISSKNISFNPSKHIYKIEAIIWAKELKPLQSTVFNLKDYDKNDTGIISVNNKPTETLKLRNATLSFELIEDKGDSYDFSPGEKPQFHQMHRVTKAWKFNNCSWEEIRSNIWINGKQTNVLWNVFMVDGEERISFELKNKFKNQRMQLRVVRANLNEFSQNSGMKQAIEKAIPEDWKTYLHEYPVNAFVNDGVLKTNRCSILTFGTNEAFKEGEDLLITLFRSYDMVTKNDMKWRPVTSGLSWEEPSPDSLLQTSLHFDFVLSSEENLNELVNRFKFRPYVYKNQIRNFIANKMTKFVINNIFNPSDEIPHFKIGHKLAILSIKNEGNSIKLRLGNLTKDMVEDFYSYKDKKVKVKLKPNQIKTITL